MSPHSLSPTVTTQSLVSTEGKSISPVRLVAPSLPYTERQPKRECSPGSSWLSSCICRECFQYSCTMDRFLIKNIIRSFLQTERYYQSLLQHRHNWEIRRGFFINMWVAWTWNHLKSLVSHILKPTKPLSLRSHVSVSGMIFKGRLFSYRSFCVWQLLSKFLSSPKV